MGGIMDVEQRKIGVVTSLGKSYSGLIDIPNANLRTTDLLNSANLFWRNPNEKCMENAILLYNVNLSLGEKAIYKKFNKVQIKISEIIFFYDDYENLGSEVEKSRVDTLNIKTGEKKQVVNIITPIIANSFYDIEGTFFGQFKKKTHDKFIPLNEVTISEICNKQDKWVKKRVSLPYSFAGINSGFIESISFY
jgi:hypothetical protein